MKSLTRSEDAGLDLQLGLRNADFDNDYHSVVGVENVEGSLVDASSNYGRMMGPLVGLSGDVRLGKSTLRGYIGQSLVFGTAELDQMTRDFVGPYTSKPTIIAQESFAKAQDTSIPITEFRLSWLYPITGRLSLGASANTSIWLDVPVPPGVTPDPGGGLTFAESTIRYFGLAVALKIRI